MRHTTACASYCPVPAIVQHTITTTLPTGQNGAFSLICHLSSVCYREVHNNNDAASTQVYISNSSRELRTQLWPGANVFACHHPTVAPSNGQVNGPIVCWSRVALAGPIRASVNLQNTARVEDISQSIRQIERYISSLYLCTVFLVFTSWRW